MGGTHYSYDDYAARTKSHASKGYTSAFTHDEDIKKKKIEPKVHPTLNPKGVTIRESRDSAAHPITIPIIIFNDLTGSMAGVPVILQKQEPKLMGMFLEDKASGKKYLGDGYPAIMVGGLDDYFAQKLYYPNGEGALQVGQFESGIEIDENLGNLWLTKNGGGNIGESYDLALYFAARHTAHDHFDKRHRKGYLFIFGDEGIFDFVSAEAVRAVIGDELQTDIPIATIIKEVKRRYHIFWGIPEHHEHTYAGYVDSIKSLLGAECVRVFDPNRVCEYIVQSVAMVEGAVTADDLIHDGTACGADRMALITLSSLAMSRSGAGLPDVLGGTAATGVKRL